VPFKTACRHRWGDRNSIFGLAVQFHSLGGDAVSEEKSNQPAGQDREEGLPRQSPIFNHRLRGENESFWDVMNQGRAAKSKECRDMIAATLHTPGAK
jgi:hypothetical protein